MGFVMTTESQDLGLTSHPKDRMRQQNILSAAWFTTRYTKTQYTGQTVPLYLAQSLISSDKNKHNVYPWLVDFSLMLNKWCDTLESISIVLIFSDRRKSSPKILNMLRLYSPSGHPRCRWVCFFVHHNRFGEITFSPVDPLQWMDAVRMPSIN